MTSPAPVLIFGYGNPSRGDDALGPELNRQVQQLIRERSLEARVEVLTDFQLQVEHLTDLYGRALVVFADASAAGRTGCRLETVVPETQPAYTSHAMSPGELLTHYHTFYGKAPPPCYLLLMSGERFELGESLSPVARHALHQALALLERSGLFTTADSAELNVALARQVMSE